MFLCKHQLENVAHIFHTDLFSEVRHFRNVVHITKETDYNLQGLNTRLTAYSYGSVST